MSEEATQTELSDIEVAVGIVNELYGSKSDDEIVIDLIQRGGFGFQKAGRLYTQALEAAGHRISKKERYEQAHKLLKDSEFEPSEWSDVVEAAEWLVGEIQDTNSQQAFASIRRFAKDEELELPARPKGEGRARSSVWDRAFGFILENPDVSDEDLTTWLTDTAGIKSKVSGLLIGIADFARRYHEVKSA